MLLGESVTIRAIERTDAEMLWTGVNRAAAGQFGDLADSPSRTVVQGWIEEWLAEELEAGRPAGFAVEDGQGRVIGAAVLDAWRPESRSVRLRFAPLDGRADAATLTEAFSVLVDACFEDWALHRVWLSVPNGDDLTLAVAQSAGFRQEARLREAGRWAGRVEDVLILGLLEDEWRR